MSSNPYPLKPRPEIVRYLDPWYDLATLCQKQEDLLTDKIDSATRIYGVVAALMCSLSAALLAVDFPSVPQKPRGDGDSDRDSDRDYDPYHRQYYAANSNNRNTNTNNAPIPASAPAHTAQSPVSSSESFPPATAQLRRRRTFFEHVVLDYSNHAAGTSLLVGRGFPPQRLEEVYAGCCALSFYTSLTSTGLAGILNAWLAATPPGGISTFAKSYSKFIALVPALLGISTLSAGTALFVGLDRSKGTPVSYFGLGGTLAGCTLLCWANVRGMNMTHRLIRRLAQKLEKRNKKRVQAVAPTSNSHAAAKSGGTSAH